MTGHRTTRTDDVAARTDDLALGPSDNARCTNDLSRLTTRATHRTGDRAAHRGDVAARRNVRAARPDDAPTCPGGRAARPGQRTGRTNGEAQRTSGEAQRTSGDTQRTNDGSNNRGDRAQLPDHVAKHMSDRATRPRDRATMSGTIAHFPRDVAALSMHDAQLSGGDAASPTDRAAWSGGFAALAAAARIDRNTATHMQRGARALSLPSRPRAYIKGRRRHAAPGPQALQTLREPTFLVSRAMARRFISLTPDSEPLDLHVHPLAPHAMERNTGARDAMFRATFPRLRCESPVSRRGDGARCGSVGRRSPRARLRPFHHPDRDCPFAGLRDARSCTTGQ